MRFISCALLTLLAAVASGYGALPVISNHCGVKICTRCDSLSVSVSSAQTGLPGRCLNVREVENPSALFDFESDRTAWQVVGAQREDRPAV